MVGDEDDVVSDGEAVKMNIQVNGCAAEAENGRIMNGNSAGSWEDDFQTYKSGNSAGSSGDGFRTYKRRKHAQAAEGGKISGESAAQIKEKSTQELPDMVVNKDACRHASVAATSSHVSRNVSYDCSVKHWRNVVLQQICESLDDEAGLLKCIRDALVLYPESGCTSAVKESVHSCEDGRKCTSLSGPGYPQFQNEVGSTKIVTLNDSVNDTKHRRVTELCQRTFLDVITSEKFASLCSLLLENFQGLRGDKVFDISLINSRMKDGTYESTPLLFFSDIQQFWIKLQKIGSDIVALANNLSEKSRASYQEQVGGLLHGSLDDGALEFVTQESDMLAKVEQTEACGIYKDCTCKCCNRKADGRDCLVCDSCEAMYHVSCIEPAVEGIPPRSWYCASCTEKGIESPHGNCVVCERINASRSLADVDGINHLTNAETSVELEESSNGMMGDGLQLSAEGKDIPRCNLCRTDIQNGEKLKICGHAFCPHKFYHARCLTSKQLNTYGPCWYCPSCLCRVCLIDRDDEKIVLCDACDHAYHIYCMQPPRTIIPTGKWFCRKCDEDIQCIRKTKRTYENSRSSLRERPEVGKASRDGRRGGKRKKQEPLDKSGGVDMLLNAARTLNYEENLATMGRRS